MLLKSPNVQALPLELLILFVWDETRKQCNLLKVMQPVNGETCIQAQVTVTSEPRILIWSYQCKLWIRVTCESVKIAL